MKSAAEKVFSIPELVEHILLAQHENRSILTGRRLFVIQRVNRLVQNIIIGSVHLQCHMGLKHHQLRPPTNPRQRLPGSRILRSRYPFKLHWIEGAIVCRSTEVPSTTRSVLRTIGLERLCDEKRSFPDSSWRKLKLSKFAKPVTIVVEITFDALLYQQCQDGRCPGKVNCLGCGVYEERLEFTAEKGNLGELVDKADAIRCRGRADHQKRQMRCVMDRIDHRIWGICKDRRITEHV